MSRVVAIGNQDFGDMIEHNDFYVDKTDFVKEWWDSRNFVTLIVNAFSICALTFRSCCIFNWIWMQNAKE